MKVDGGCLCGHVQYEAEVDPQRVAFCHCTDCQINSGCAMGWVIAVVGERFELKSFCPECGTRIVAKPVDGEQGIVSLRAGSVRQRAQLPPRVHLWARSAQPWIDALHELPKLEKQR